MRWLLEGVGEEFKVQTKARARIAGDTPSGECSYVGLGATVPAEDLTDSVRAGKCPVRNREARARGGTQNSTLAAFLIDAAMFRSIIWREACARSRWIWATASSGTVTFRWRMCASRAEYRTHCSVT